MTTRLHELQAHLDSRVDLYNNASFVQDDPICIPHQFTKQIDIEIAAFWTAMLSWGQRKTIIQKSRLLFELMDNAPGDFVLHHSESDLARFEKFVHRTFQPTDALYFIHFFKRHFSESESLESAFDMVDRGAGIKERLEAFHRYFFLPEWAPARTRKHVSTPLSKSACKRLNMFLRWMVRNDDRGVDFGLWKVIKPAELMIPLDLHVHRVATRLGLLNRKQSDWQSVEELTTALRNFDPVDPVKYDYALFGIGVLETDPRG